MLMTILSIPTMLFFFYGTELADSGFKNVAAAASLGNLGSSQPVCTTARFDLVSESRSLNNPYVQFKLSCPFGELWEINEFGQLSVSTVVDCEAATSLQEDGDAWHDAFYPPDCSYTHFPDEEKNYLDSKFASECKGKASCSLSLR